MSGIAKSAKSHQEGQESKYLTGIRLLVQGNPGAPGNHGKNALCASILLLLLLPFTYLTFRPDGYSLPQPGLGEFANLHAHCAEVPPIAASEFRLRQKSLARTLHSLNGSVYIAEPGADALFFGNISQSSWHLSERPFLLMISPVSLSNGDIDPTVTILTPKFEASRAKFLSIPALNLSFVEWAEDEDPYLTAVSSFPTSALVGGTIFIAESSRLFIKDGLEAAAPNAIVTSAPLPIRSLRQRKSSAEISLLRCVNEITLLAIRAVRAKMYLGIHQSETQQLIIDALTSAGLTDASALVLFGGNAAFPHGGASDRALGKHDFTLFDVTASLYGYYSDITRTFALNDSSIPSEHLVIWKSVHTAQQAALAAAKEGALTRIVDEKARAIIGQAGYGKYFTHRLGHGIGLEVHEAPYLRGGSSDVIQIGHTFSDEPGVYIEGKVGARLEDCFVIGDDGNASFLTEGVGGAANSPWQP